MAAGGIPLPPFFCAGEGASGRRNIRIAFGVRQRAKWILYHQDGRSGLCQTLLPRTR